MAWRKFSEGRDLRDGEGFPAVLTALVLEADNMGLVGGPGMAPCPSQDKLSMVSGPILVGPAAG